MGQTNRRPINRSPSPVPTKPRCFKADGQMGGSSASNPIDPMKHSKTMEIGQSLMEFVLGKGGHIRKEIEQETGVKLVFPSSRSEESIIIKGYTIKSVTKASEKIQLIIDQAVNGRSLDYSHFVSLPLAIHRGLVDKLIQFQNTVLEIACDHDKKLDGKGDAKAVTRVKTNATSIPHVSHGQKNSGNFSSSSSSSKYRDLGIDKSIFINPKTFHLTILMLKLWNKKRVDAASEVLQSVSPKVLEALKHQPVSIKLKGLECMRGSKDKACILYAPVEIDDNERFMSAIKVIIDAFAEAGLIIERDLQHQLKLHGTLMNVRHRKRGNITRQPDWFDARAIFNRYGSEDWGEYPIPEVHLSKRFAYDTNGYYHCCAAIPFPTTTI